MNTHTNETRYGPGGDCLTCGVKWPCPTEVRRRGRTRYESHIWSRLTDEDDEDCLARSATWEDCDDDCPGALYDHTRRDNRADLIAAPEEESA